MIRRWAFIIGVALAALMLSACWPTVPDDPNAKKEFCGLPCDADLNIDCPDGFACVSGICLNSKVCDSCGQTCTDDSDCTDNWTCAIAWNAPEGSPKYCWPSPYSPGPDPDPLACTQVNEDHCGKPCEPLGYSEYTGDTYPGGYRCVNGVLVSMNHELCSTCAKDCTTNADCAPGVACVQFPDYSGGTTGLCWDDDICTAPPAVQVVTPPVLGPLPTPTAPPVNPLPPQPNQPACGDGICDPATENRDLCGADCPCVDDGVCGLGETGQCFDCITPEGNSSGGDTGTGGGDTGSTDGGTCQCAIVCIRTNRAGACIERGYRDCNGNVCSP